jgi:hypothetical protein
MTKYIFYFLVLIVTKLSAQTIDINAIEKIEIQKDNKTNLILNFNKLNKSIKKNDEFVLEIQPINDCLNGVNGATMFEPTLIDIKTIKTKEIEINYQIVKRKCFKWRVKTVKNKETNYSDWNFHSLVR